jgi:hypothetical protein
MANIKITALPANTSVTPGSDVLPLVSAGVTTKATPSQIVNATLLAPGPIGSTTPGSGNFTTLNVANTISGAGFSNYLASPPPIGSSSANSGRFTTLTVNGSTTLNVGLNGLLLSTSGVVSAATAGVNYAPATSGTSILYGNGSGGFSGVTIGSGLTFSSGTLSATGGGGSGTVTSVGLSLPNIFNVTNSPVTTTGTLTGALATQTANYVFAGPTTGSAAVPTFRSLVANDIPALSYAPATTGSSILYANGSGGFSSVTVGSGLSFSAGTLASTSSGGSVTTVSVVSANGLAGTVANASSTPAITLSTSITGLLKGNGTAISAATAGTDYAAATTGTNTQLLANNGSGGFSNVTVGSGLTLTSGTLAATSGGGGTVTSVSGTGTVNGLTLTGTVTTSGSLTLGGTLDLSTPPAIGGTTPAAITGTTVTANTKFVSSYFDASGSGGGALRTSSGTACLQWGGGGGTNLTLDGAFNMNPANASISIAPTGTGTLTVNPATAGTIDNVAIGGTTAAAGKFTTLTATGTTTLATSLTGLLKSTSGVVSTATAGTDYAAATTGTNAQLLANNGSGGFSNVTVGSGLNLTTGTLTAPSTMTYPGAGIANSTGSAWGTSYTTSGSGTVVALSTSPSFTTPTLGVASATTVNKVTLTAPATGSTLTIADGKILTASNSITLAGTDSTTMTFPPASASVGYLNIPQNAQTSAYTLVLADSGKHIYMAAAQAATTMTIPANGTVAFPIGTAITFVNMSVNAMTIAITTDTMYLGGTGTTGSRTLAQYGTATALKMTSTTWIISGSGLT